MGKQIIVSILFLFMCIAVFATNAGTPANEEKVFFYTTKISPIEREEIYLRAVQFSMYIDNIQSITQGEGKFLQAKLDTLIRLCVINKLVKDSTLIKK